MALQYYQTKDTQVNMLQNAWKAQLDVMLANPLFKGRQLSATLINGITVINHGLSRKLQGWFIVGIDGAATIYDSQASNQHQDLTLVLNSNAAVTISLWVY